MAAGLYRAGDDIPAEAMISALDNAELRACITAVRLRPARTKAENAALLADALDEDADGVGPKIRECREWSRYVGIMPPEGLDWDTFQGIRQQTKGMIITLRDFLGGWLLRDRPKGRNLHEALRYILPTSSAQPKA